MKVAFTMNGLFGGLKGKNTDNSDNTQLPILAKYLYKSLDDRILKNNDVDIFLFTWHHQDGDLIDEIYKPASSVHIEQIDFEPFEHLKHGNIPRVKAHISRWYGFKKVNELRIKYEEENNFKYDLIVNGRLDHHWERDIFFDNYDVNQVHTSYLSDRQFMQPHHAFGRGSDEVRGDFFAMNPENMNKMASIYESLHEYTLPGQCPQWNTISHHFLTFWHFKKMGWVQNNIVKYDFPTSITVTKTQDSRDVDFLILREKVEYENLSIEDLK